MLRSRNVDSYWVEQVARKHLKDVKPYLKWLAKVFEHLPRTFCYEYILEISREFETTGY